MFKRYPVEVRERATRMVLERLADYPSVNAAVTDLGGKLNVGAETLRKWVSQAQIDAGGKAGPTSGELAEIKTLRKEVRDLREANEILHASAVFFARELDPRRRA